MLHELIQRAKRGDRDARDRVLERAWHFVRDDSICEAIAERADSDPEDLLQRFVFRLKKRVSSWPEDGFESRLRKWWGQLVIDLSREASLHLVPPDTLRETCSSSRKTWPDVATGYGRREPRGFFRKHYEEKVRESLEVLPESQREVIEMRFLEGYSNKEIAKKLSVTESTVSSRIYRAKGNEKLKERLQALI